MRLGSKGNEVAKIQQRLIELGFLQGKADGIFGPLTKNAVISFQNANNLIQDGIVGPATLSALDYKSPPSTGDTNMPPSSHNIYGLLKVGSRGSSVVTLQKRLNELGYNCGNVDGFFGTLTRKAVISFQQANYLAQDGLVGPQTIAKLFAKPSTPTPNPEPPQEFQPFHGVPGSLSGKTIIIDPGHGGWDSGAYRGGVMEKSLVLDMGLRLKRILEESGANVIMTRSEDRYYSLYYRSALSNQHILSLENAKTILEKNLLNKQLTNIQAQLLQKSQSKKNKTELLTQILSQVGLDGDALLQIPSILAVLETQKQQLLNEYEFYNTIYERKSNEYNSVAQHLDMLIEQLANFKQNIDDLNNEQSQLIAQRNEKISQKATLESEYQDLCISVASLEKEIANLYQLLNSTQDEEESITLEILYQESMLDLNEARAAQVSKQIEISSANSFIESIDGKITQNKSSINQTSVLINSKEAEIVAYQSLLENYKRAMISALEEKDTAQNELLTLEDTIYEVSNAQKDISRLDSEIVLLNHQIKELSMEIQLMTNSIYHRNRLIDLFKIYTDNPSFNERKGIYQGETGPIKGKRYATKELVDVMDLTKNSYQDNIIFISIHCNDTVESVTTASGVQVYYRDNGPYGFDGTYGINTEYYKNYNASKRYQLSMHLLKALNQATDFSHKYTQPFKKDLSVLRENNLVSALVEIGFLNNPADRSLVLQEQTRENTAMGIYKGIVEYFK